LHYVGDYPLQGEFLAQTKGKYWYSCLAHSMIYGLGMTVLLSILYKPVGLISILIATILVASHCVIDTFKATALNKDKALTTYLYIDQSFHIIINLTIMIILHMIQ
jgi:hypothetical protein